MTVWKSLQTPQFGVVVYNFNGGGAHRLRLQLGETVQILEENSGWFRGYSSKNKTVKGIFPKSFIQVKEINSEVSSGQVTGFSEDHLVEEVTSVLREWGLMWKHLYSRKEDNLFQMVKKLMLDLMDWRRQILAQALPVDQVKQLKAKITSTIDYGNRILGLDLVVRDDSGNIIDPDSTGVIELYRRHMSTSNRIQSSREEAPRKETTTYTTHSVYVNIKNVVCNVHDDAEVFIGLYDAKEGQFISEQYMVSWDKGGMPKDIDRLYNLSVLFTDLGSKDLKKDKMYIVCQIVRIGRMDQKDTDSKKLTHNLRRPFGIAVFHIGDMISGEVQYEDDKELFLQLHTIENQFFDSWTKKVILTPQDSKDAKGTGQGIWISARLLAGNVEQIREEHPLIVTRHTSVARKLGFPEVIMPGDVRNDLYVTILSGEFEKGGKRSSKNIEVTMHVCSEDGTILEKVISLGAGEDLVSEYRSCIFYHSGKPEWVETIKLVIPIEQFYLSHLRFTFKHRSGAEERDRTQKVFAFTYANLMHKDGTTLSDGNHDLVVFKSDGKKLNPRDYLSAPSNRNFLSTMQSGKEMPSNDKFQIRTLLCSTKLTQNVDLLGLLKWRAMPGKLKEILVTVMKVSGEEIVKFLTDTFDALFAILMEHSSKYDKLVFDALVFTISLLADKKYHHFRPVLDAYIEGLFGATKAHVTLIAVLRGHYIANALREAKDVNKIDIDLLLKAMKAMEYIFKFIVQSRVLFKRAVGEKGKSEFEDDLRGLFKALVDLMKDTKNETLLIQGAALKYFPATFSDLLKVFDAQELGYVARDFIEQIPAKRLTSQKMDCVHNMVKSKLFEDPNSRRVLLPMVVAQLSRVMEKSEEMKTCIDVLNDILTSLMRKNVGDTHEDILLLVTSLLGVVVKGVIAMDRSEKVVGNYVACLTAMLQVMEEDHYRQYVAHFKNPAELLDFLMMLFLLFREFVSNNVYPTDWMVMTMVQNSVILNAMQYFSDALHETFLGERFEYQLWNNFFHLAVAFVNQDSLQLENFTQAKQDKILEKYSDMRMIIGLKISEMWHCLGSHKCEFIPGLVGNFLEMTLIPHKELRRATIPIFFNMIEVEFASQKSFEKVEAEIISKLDVLVEGGRGDEEYKKLFHKILSDLFSGHPVLEEAGIRFVELVTKLMERLLDYRTVISAGDNIDNRMSCTVNVLNFYREIGREEMYGRYVYKLCDLHLSVESYTEAGFTLLRRADDLKWTDDPVYSRQGKYQASTQRQLKEMLYNDIIDYFDKGKCWEYAIKLCKALAEQYEYGTFDFIHLSQILMKQAKFYDNIIKVVRGEPEYFRVGFFGQGFPSFLRNKLFVYRGKEYERLGDFIVRIQSQYPSAEVLKYITPPPEEIRRSNRQHLQINKVDPSPVERRKFQGKNVMEQITQFYEVNNVNKFQFSRPFHKGTKDKESEFKTMWLERTTMYTKFTFPGILCWFEVSNVDVDEVSPIQNALETMESANKGMRSLIGRHKTDTNLSVGPLSMKLKGIIDASVMGGISNYEKLFLTPEFLQENAQYQNHVDRLKELIVEQVNILEQGVALHASRVSDSLRPFHENLEKCFKEMKSKTASYRRQHSRVSTAQVPRSALHRDTIVRRSGDGRATLQHRDSFEDLHQSYSDWSVGSQSPPPVLPQKRNPTMSSSPSGRPSRINRRSTTEARYTYTQSETSSIIQAETPPAKPPRPQNDVEQSAPPVPQKSIKRLSDQRSSTGSSGSEQGPGLESGPSGSPALPPRGQTMSRDLPPVPPKAR